MGFARGLGVVFGVVSMTTLGCSTTATVHRSNGYLMEGRIEGGTPDSIIVRPNVGQRQEVLRRELVDIDHPGNVHAIIGGLVLGYGGIIIGSGIDNCDDQTRGAECFGLFIPAIVGVSILSWGLFTWFESTDAVDDVSMRPLRRGPRRDLPPRWEQQPPPLPPEEDDEALPPPPPAPPGIAPKAAAPTPPAPAAPPSSAAPPAPAPPPPSSAPPVSPAPVW